MVSLQMADTLGFEVLYMTGFGAVASLTGVLDAGLAIFPMTTLLASALAM
jgi:2-methylisocitrate lyase-like PEP mutase family enzyme